MFIVTEQVQVPRPTCPRYVSFPQTEEIHFNVGLIKMYILAEKMFISLVKTKIRYFKIRFRTKTLKSLKSFKKPVSAAITPIPYY